MNRKLMMKAAVQFKGVWPDQEETHLYKFQYGRFVTGMDGGAVDLVCTREEFEAFVESLFEGAPGDATHFRPNSPAKWYKTLKIDGDILVSHSIDGCKWRTSMSYESGCISIEELIPRPAKKAEPEAPYMPKVDEECEAIWRGTEEWEKVIYVGDFLFFEIAKHSYAKFNLSKLENLQFRPLRTEREIFIEQATKDYLDQVGSHAVNAKRFERIFGALYDKGYIKN